MASKTVKRSAILIVVVLVVIGASFFAWRWQVDRMARGVVEQADRAEQAGDFARAEQLYRGHLAVVPDDLEVKIKYADALLKADRSARRQEQAVGIYGDVLRRFPGREDVRRKLAELAVELGAMELAQKQLDILLKSDAATRDGHLQYLMGRCLEWQRDFERAEKSYRSALDNDAPERLDAARRLATLLRLELKKPEEADRVMDAEVESGSGGRRAYLVRGQYRSRFKLPGAGDDFSKALDLAPDQPEVYLEVARAAEQDGRVDTAREALNKGLAKTKDSAELYLALAGLERRARRPDAAIDALERGIKVHPDQPALRIELAMILADRGDTGKLLMQVTELERLSISSLLTNYLSAAYHFNNHQYGKARQILTSLQPEVARSPGLKVLVNTLLARCYGELSETELQREATLRAFGANPDDMRARLPYIQSLVARGEIDEAIREHRAIVDRQPALRLPLAALLMDQNRRLPPARRDWSEAEKLIDAAAAAASDAVEPMIARAELRLAQGQPAAAAEVLKVARERFPDSPAAWTSGVTLLAGQGKLDEATKLLDQAGRRLGDRSELRLARARLWEIKGGPQAAAGLRELARNLDPFSRDERRRLLNALAAGLTRLRDRAGAVELWSTLAELEPETLSPRLALFNLAIEAGDAKAAEGQIAAIGRLDEQFALYCRATYQMWQAQQPGADVPREQLRGDARTILNELKSRRPDWALVPLALARLDEQELDQAGLDQARKQEKREAAIASYRKAIELGYRDPAVTRQLARLLFKAGRGSEALDLSNQLTTAGQVITDPGQIALELGRSQRDFRTAEDLARKAIAERPDDFQERIWLARILLEDHRPDEAEAEIRAAITEAPGDSDRWITLIRILSANRQPDKAEQAVRDAEAHLSGNPMAMAQCCELAGDAYAAVDSERARSWYDRTRGWYLKAQAAVKDPGDLTILRRLAEFLLHSRQYAEAERVLEDILKRASGGKSPELATWARRRLAQTYISTAPRRTAEALALLGGANREGPADPEDVSLRARVHEAQGTPEGQRQAIADLQSLVDRDLAGPEDRFSLAQLLLASGQWPRAREQFRQLIQRTENARDIPTLVRRPVYLRAYAETLIGNHKPGDDTDLAEAAQVVERLKPIDRDPFRILVLESRIDKAAGRAESALARLKVFGDRKDITPAGRVLLARLAEDLGFFDEAEAMFRRIAAVPPARPNTFPLARYLARRGRLKEALDVCEGLWADEAIRADVLTLCVQTLTDAPSPVDRAQVERLIGWIERARAEKPQSASYGSALGTIYDSLGDYTRAEQLYRAAVQANERDAGASNNLAWVIALRDGSRRGPEALELINRAIRVQGEVPELLDTRGVVYLTVGDNARALNDLQKAWQAAPTPSKYFHLAQAYLQANDREKARQILAAGKARGLPSGLHHLELAAYDRTLNELKIP